MRSSASATALGLGSNDALGGGAGPPGKPLAAGHNKHGVPTPALLVAWRNDATPVPAWAAPAHAATPPTRAPLTVGGSAATLPRTSAAAAFVASPAVSGSVSVSGRAQAMSGVNKSLEFGSAPFAFASPVRPHSSSMGARTLGSPAVGVHRNALGGTPRSIGGLAAAGSGAGASTPPTGSSRFLSSFGFAGSADALSGANSHDADGAATEASDAAAPCTLADLNAFLLQRPATAATANGAPGTPMNVSRIGIDPRPFGALLRRFLTAATAAATAAAKKPGDTGAIAAGAATGATAPAQIVADNARPLLGLLSTVRSDEPTLYLLLKVLAVLLRTQPLLRTQLTTAHVQSLFELMALPPAISAESGGGVSGSTPRYATARIRREAAHVMLHACGHKEVVALVVAERGVQPLLALFQHEGDPLCQTFAAGSLHSICYHLDGQYQFMAVGGSIALRYIIALLRTDAKPAAGGDGGTARGSGGAGSNAGSRLRWRAAGILHNLSVLPSAIRVIRETEDSLSTLVALLTLPATPLTASASASAAVLTRQQLAQQFGLCASVAGTLQNVSREPAARLVLQSLGTVDRLIPFLYCGDIPCQAAAAAALLNIMSPELGDAQARVSGVAGAKPTGSKAAAKPAKDDPRKALFKRMLTDAIVIGVMRSVLPPDLASQLTGMPPDMTTLGLTATAPAPATFTTATTASSSAASKSLADTKTRARSDADPAVSDGDGDDDDDPKVVVDAVVAAADAGDHADPFPGAASGGAHNFLM